MRNAFTAGNPETRERSKGRPDIVRQHPGAYFETRDGRYFVVNPQLGYIAVPADVARGRIARSIPEPIMFPCERCGRADYTPASADAGRFLCERCEARRVPPTAEGGK